MTTSSASMNQLIERPLFAQAGASTPDADAPSVEQALPMPVLTPAARYRMGRLLLEAGQTQRALDELTLSLTLRPGFVQPALLLARLAADRGNLEGAKEILLETLEHEPRSTALLEALVQLARARNAAAEALCYAERWAEAICARLGGGSTRNGLCAEVA